MTAYKSTSLSLASGIDFGIDFFEAHVGNTVFGNAALCAIACIADSTFCGIRVLTASGSEFPNFIFYKPRANAYLCYKDSLSASFKKSSAVGNCSHSILLSRAYSAASSSLPIAIYSFSSPETIFFPSR